MHCSKIERQILKFTTRNNVSCFRQNSQQPINTRMECFMMKEIPVKLYLPEIDRFNIEEVVFTDHSYCGIDLPREVAIGIGHISSSEEKEKVLKSWKQSAELYNTSIKRIFQIPGFKDRFVANGGYITRNEVKSLFGSKAEETVWNMYRLYGTQFQLTSDSFSLNELHPKCTFSINSNEYEYDLFCAPGDFSIQNGNICIFDWNDNCACLGYALYLRFYHDIPDLADFSCDMSLDNAVNDGDLHPVFIAGLHFVKSMEEFGYLHSYKLILQNPRYDSIWNAYTHKSDYSVSLFILDSNYKKDNLLVERIKALFSYLPAYDEDELPRQDNPNAIPYESDSYCEFDFSQKFYFLQDTNDKVYVSRKAGQFGGHNKLKIYGRLDCPSALRYLAKGQYAKHRVFFADESTAIAAGYRPCGVCMKNAYIEWKSKKK